MKKTCCKCKEVKALDEFHKERRYKDGLRPTCKACRKAYRKARKEEKKDYDKAYRKANKEDIAQTKKAYREVKPEKFAAASAKRRAAKLQATPHWLTEADHKEIAKKYKYARYLTDLTGEVWHVDHIHPLQGENICGLHVPSNLQVIPASENQSKSNKYERI